MSLTGKENVKFVTDKENETLVNIRTVDFSSATGTSTSLNGYLVNGTGVLYGLSVAFGLTTVGAKTDSVTVYDSTAASGAVLATILAGSTSTVREFFPTTPIQSYAGVYLAVTTGTAATSVTINAVYK